MRLIDADDFIARFDHVPMIQEAIKKAMDCIPIIEERKKGKWIHGREVCREYIGPTLMIVRYSHWECSVCGYRTENEPLWKFCPNCGAEMERERE